VTPQEVANEIKELMAARLGLPAEKIVPEASLVEDLGLDSLDAVELAIAVERRFNIDVPEEELTKLKTVADMVALVEARRGRGPAVGRVAPGERLGGRHRRRPEPDRQAGPQDERGGDRFGASVSAEDDAGRLVLTCPRREARQIQERRGATPRLRLHTELERDKLGPVPPIRLVRALTRKPLPAHDPRNQPAVGLRRPPAFGIVQGGTHDVVDVHAHRQRDRVVGDS
jgi:acyl carrier protein